MPLDPIPALGIAVDLRVPVGFGIAVLVAAAPVVHAVYVAVLEDRDVAARVPLPGRVVAHGDVLRLRPVQTKLGPVQPLDEVVVDEQLEPGAYIDAGF